MWRRKGHCWDGLDAALRSGRPQFAAARRAVRHWALSSLAVAAAAATAVVARHQGPLTAQARGSFADGAVCRPCGNSEEPDRARWRRVM